MRQAARITIGQAVADLKAEFPDVDIKESKIRHLENEGLVEPERTPSGYRKYSVDDMEKLRYIIRAQREHYLPLQGDPGAPRRPRPRPRAAGAQRCRPASPAR